MRATPGYRSLYPKHAVREGLMALAEDKRPEATLLITFELVCIATPRGCHNLRWQSIGWSPAKISDALPNSQIGMVRH